MLLIVPGDFIHDGYPKGKSLPCPCPSTANHVTTLHCRLQNSSLNREEPGDPFLRQRGNYILMNIKLRYVKASIPSSRLLLIGVIRDGKPRRLRGKRRPEIQTRRSRM
uniref:Uncharacterized protein n=1 Tax=Opuntia streptacantha TaxID=393608 RepID=A0A7C9A9X7_OPUST